MSDAVVVSVIGGVCSLVAAVGAAIAAYLDHQNRKAIEHIHVLVNSRLSEALTKIEELEGLLNQRSG